MNPSDREQYHIHTDLIHNTHAHLIPDGYLLPYPHPSQNVKMGVHAKLNGSSTSARQNLAHLYHAIKNQEIFDILKMCVYIIKLIKFICEPTTRAFKPKLHSFHINYLLEY